jgi:hypothetical protein
MATVIGDRDVLLLGSSQRALNPLNSGILLTTSAPAFKVDTSGNPLPSSITVKASLIGITGFVNFSATGATVTDHGDNTATLAYSSLTGASCTVTANITVNGQAFTSSVTLAKVTDGASGTSGTSGNQYATAYLYQWAPSTPALPTGTSGYTWSTGVNSTYSASDGWSTTVPANPGTPGLKLYVASTQVTASAGTTSTVVSYSTASVQAWTQNGANGTNGTNGTNGANGVQSVNARVYQWAATIPAAPAGSPTYTWSNGNISVIPSGWSSTPGTAPSQGMTLWAAQVFVTDTATATQTTFNWSNSAVVAVGYSGSNGAAGASGASYVTAYCASSTGTTSTAPAQTTGKTSLPATNDGGIAGTWAATVPTLSTGQYLYQSDGIYDPSTNKVTWSIPYWSSLKVGSLSAVSANTGRLTVSDVISDAGGNWSLDSNGHMIAKSIDLQDSAGNTFLSAGVPLPASHFGGTLGGDNLMNNSSFEVQDSSNVPLGYRVYNNGGSASVSYLIVPGRTGGKAFAIRATATSSTTFGLTSSNLYADPGVTGGIQGGWQPNKTYIVSFKAKKVNGANMNTMWLQWNTAPATATWVTRPNLTTSWQTYTARITWGSSVESQGQLYLDTINGVGPVVSGDEFWIDELIIQEGDVYSEWFQSSREAKATADSAINTLNTIADDNTLSKGEKSAAIAAWNAADAEWNTLLTQADSLGVDRSAYNTAHQNLSNYLLSISPSWSDTTTDSPIVGSTWRSNWTSYYNEKQKLINALAAKASTLSTWNGVSGAGKPQDNATNGNVINGDPNFVNASLWTVWQNTSNANIQFNYAANAPGQTAPTCVLPTNPAGTGNAEVWLLENKRYPISAAKTYRLAAYIYSSSGNDRMFYLAVDFYDVSGNRLGTSWGGTWSGYPVSGVPTSNSTFNRYKGDFGANTSYAIPAGAVTCSVGIILNYNPSGYNGGVMAAQGFVFTDITDGATIGLNLGGQFTSSNASTYIANAAIQSAMINDLRTSNYAEDGSGNPTSGAKMASGGTAMKVASDNLQIGSRVFTDYWFRLLQGIDGSYSVGRVIWRGNNDVSTRGGAPNINCLSMTSQMSLNSNSRQIAIFGYTLTPTSYNSYTDNLDAMSQIHVQLFDNATDASPASEAYEVCNSRTYDGNAGAVRGTVICWKLSPYETVYGYAGYVRARISNSYGWSATKDFGPATSFGGTLPNATITGTGGSSGGGSGGTSGGGGGACPAPWVKVKLVNGKEVNASELHNGARVMAVDDNTMESLPNGGVLRDVHTIWSKRYRLKLTNGEATEWSANHRFAVVDRGWVNIQNLRPGDHIMGLKECTVESVLFVGEGEVVSYRVEGAGTYFAGNMLCHNLKTPS